MRKSGWDGSSGDGGEGGELEMISVGFSVGIATGVWIDVHEVYECCMLCSINDII